MTRTPGLFFSGAVFFAVVSVWLLWTLVLEETNLERDTDAIVDTTLWIAVPAIVALVLAAVGFRMSRNR